MARSNSSRVGIRDQTRSASNHRPLSADYPCSETYLQRSADFSKSSTSAVITVKKSTKEPEPPRRTVSLPRPQAANPTSKRYSCPAFGITTQKLYQFCSLSASSSPPPLIQTSSITGPDPLGWKVRHKIGNTTSRSRTERLSLQIPLLDAFPETKSQQSSNSSISGCPKPSRRHNSDSLAFLRSSGTTMPVTMEELSTFKLRRANSISNPDVFEENVEKTEQNIKEPPPVPIKSEMARQVAELIAFSRELSIETIRNHEEHFNTKM